MKNRLGAWPHGLICLASAFVFFYTLCVTVVPELEKTVGWISLTSLVIMVFSGVTWARFCIRKRKKVDANNRRGAE